MKRVLLMMVVSLIGGHVVGCDGPQEEEAQEDKASAPWEDVQGNADRLAATVVKAHGVEAFEALSTLSFDFVVIGEGEEVFRASHRWDLEANKDRIVWAHEEGEVEVLLDVDGKKALEATIEGQEPDEERRQKIEETAYQRWVNDTYWLLMSIKLFDPGVYREHLGTHEVDGQAYEVLELSFEEVGLTPGDRYEVRADSESGEIHSWVMDLEGGDETTEVMWGDYQDVGPLRLSLERDWAEADRQIRLDDVTVE